MRISEALKQTITREYTGRLLTFGSLREGIEREMQGLSGLRRVFCEFMYSTLPLSDVGDYPFSLFLAYADHAVFLWENCPWLDGVCAEDFLNYILYPRVNSEDLTDCRALFCEALRDRIQGRTARVAALEANNWCYEQATYHSTSARTASPLTVIRGGYGRCGEESVLLVSVLRSIGICARQVYVPRWSHTESNHAWVELLIDGSWHFTGACEPKPVLDNGWFTYAASRAMIVHSRVFGHYLAKRQQADPVNKNEYAGCLGNRALSEGLPASMAGQDERGTRLPDEVIGHDGIVTVLNQTARYASVKRFRVSVQGENGKSAAGVSVRYEIVNGGVFFPVAEQVTDEDGNTEITLGLGTIRLSAFVPASRCAEEENAGAGLRRNPEGVEAARELPHQQGDGQKQPEALSGLSGNRPYAAEVSYLSAEAFCEVADTDSAVLVLRPCRCSDTWEPFRLTAPESSFISGVELTDLQEEEQNRRNAAGDLIRNARIASYADSELMARFQGCPQIQRAISQSYGNIGEIRDFLTSCPEDASKLNRFFASLAQKDCRDITAAVLRDHISAYELEPAPKAPDGTVSSEHSLADDEGDYTPEDIKAEFYRAPMDFFTQYVASPGIWIERATAYRSGIRAFFGKKLPFADAGQVWDWLSEHICREQAEEYPTITTSPEAALRLGRGSSLSAELLFIAICRTCGIPARLNMATRKAQVYDGTDFRYADGSCPDALLKLNFPEEAWGNQRRGFALEYFHEENEAWSPVFHPALWGNACEKTVWLRPGFYRITVSNRLPGGSVSGRKLEFVLDSGSEKRFTILPERAVPITEGAVYRKLPPFAAKTESVSDNGLRLFLFLKPGQEPTIHVLNELVSLGKAGYPFRIPVLFAAAGRIGKSWETAEASREQAEHCRESIPAEDPLLRQAADAAHAAFITVDDSLFEAFCGISPEEAAHYPYICVTDGDSLIFRTEGYQAGIMPELFERIDAEQARRK